MKKYPLYLFVIIFLVPSCGYQKFSRNQVAKNVKQSVFIKMAENTLVFDNLSSVIYKSLYKTYQRLGYKILDDMNNSFILKTKIKSLEPIEKFISQDLLLYNVRLVIKIECKLFDLEDKLISEKNITSSSIVYYPKDPIQTSKFLDYEYKKLINRASLKIENYFRMYFLK